MIRSPHTDSDFFRPRNPPTPVAPQNVESCCIWDSVQCVEQPWGAGPPNVTIIGWTRSTATPPGTGSFGKLRLLTITVDCSGIAASRRAGERRQRSDLAAE